MRVSSREAATSLRVSQRQVQRHAAGRRLQSSTVSGRVVVSGRSVVALARSAGRGRRWDAETVAASLDVLAEGSTTRLDPSRRSRLRARMRSMSAQALAYHVLGDRVTLWRRTESSPTHPGSLAWDLVGLTEDGGTSVRSIDGLHDPIRERLVQDDDGDVVRVERGLERATMAEIVALYAYGDARESSAARAWIERRLGAL